MLKKIPLWLQIALLFVALDFAILALSLATHRNLDLFQLLNLIPSLSFYMLFNDLHPWPVILIGLAGFFIFGSLFGRILQKSAGKKLWLKMAIFFGLYYVISIWSMTEICILNNCGQGILAVFITLPDFIFKIPFDFTRLGGTGGIMLVGAIFYGLIGALVGMILQIIHKKLTRF